MESTPVPLVTESPRGFTLVELLVVLAIITIITMVTLLSQASFNRSLLLTSTTYTVALSIREAQSLGLSSRINGGVQNAGYGVNFASSTPTAYRIFSDSLNTATKPSWCPTGTANTPEEKPGNCRYDAATETVTTYSLNKGFSITDFCGLTSAGVKYCMSDTLQEMDIVFLRPNTESIITGMTTQSAGGGFGPGQQGGGGRGGTNFVTVQLSCAVIWIKTPTATGEKKCIVVSQVGQVSVPQACPASTFTSCPT